MENTYFNLTSFDTFDSFDKNRQAQHQLIRRTTLQTTAPPRRRYAAGGDCSPLGRALTGEATLHLRQRTEEGAFRLRGNPPGFKKPMGDMKGKDSG